jgi:hypothetical protein
MGRVGGGALCVEAKFLLQNRERNDGIKMGRISFGVLGKYKDTVPLCNISITTTSIAPPLPAGVKEIV